MFIKTEERKRETEDRIFYPLSSTVDDFKSGVSEGI